ncbi:hypothetical protein ABZ816_38055 [Actinosynnema sp. NPDC047251]|uniref:hypothetical protein n=1 Tax=Saccharothrix espanaensis TaxID=103731 RepID=UPI00068838AE|nr:hypothetical protein [Saccharothrix espanaensis]
MISSRLLGHTIAAARVSGNWARFARPPSHEADNVNGFQTQCGDRNVWLNQRRYLILKHSSGGPIIDPNQPDMFATGGMSALPVRMSRHARQTWLIEDHVPEVLQHKRIGHKFRSVMGVYFHVTRPMIDTMLEALQLRWEQYGSRMV